MPPVGKLLKNDGPACRVCGCTENNACLVPIGLVHDGGCSWVKIEANTPPLCSACSGTPQDLAEAHTRAARALEMYGGGAVEIVILICKAALVRYRKRQKGA